MLLTLISVKKNNTAEGLKFRIAVMAPPRYALDANEMKIEAQNRTSNNSEVFFTSAALLLGVLRLSEVPTIPLVKAINDNHTIGR